MRAPGYIGAIGLLLAAYPAEAGKELINLSAADGEEILVSEGTRRIPGKEPPPPPSEELGEVDPAAVPPPAPNLPREFIPVPDRWRLVEAIGVADKWWDPYNQNVLKGDRPIAQPDWFITLAAISDTVFEPRRVPTPIADRRATGRTRSISSVTANSFCSTRT